MNKSADNNIRAANELTVAHQGLLRANMLFGLIEYAVSSGNVSELRALSLAAIGVKVTRTYGERAEAEANYFKRMTLG